MQGVLIALNNPSLLATDTEAEIQIPQAPLVSRCLQAPARLCAAMTPSNKVLSHVSWHRLDELPAPMPPAGRQREPEGGIPPA